MEATGQTRTGTRGPVASQISRGIVRLNASLYGRGPVKAKTFIEDDCVVCVLESVFTTAERTLIEMGKPEEVRRARAAFAEATEKEFCQIVADATGREVRGCMAAIHTDLDTAAKVFFLERDGQAASNGSGRTPS